MSRRAAVPYLTAAVFFLLYATLAVLRVRRMEATAYDLGIFTQAVRSYAELRAPVADLKGPGFPLLGDHFHPILALLAPLYAVFPTPTTLVVAQAALFGLSVLPVTRLAVGALGVRAGGCVGVAYGLSFGVQQAVVFDFHEVAFAVPLLAFCAEALLRERWRRAFWWAVPLLLVKEDQAAVVVAVGGYLFLRGQRRSGALLAALGVAGGLLTVFVLIPAVHPDGVYPYLGTTGGGGNPLLRLLAPAPKWWLVFLLLLGGGFAAVLSPLALVAVPPLLLRFWTEKPAYWATEFHYNSVLMPVLFAAAVDGLCRLRDLLVARGAPAGRRRWSRAAVPAVAGFMAVYALAATAAQPLGTLVRPQTWRVPPEVTAARRLLAAHVPDGAAVAADNVVAPLLVSRCVVRMFPDAVDPRGNPLPAPRPPDTPWVATREPPFPFPLKPDAHRRFVASLPTYGYTLVAAGGGVLLFRRG
ncbi:MAG TPA: DUF2079 domain-containing protein [Pilimelia sp.]|nr:DUF2079 domain-containing protein [Pilimelia sp.]